MRQEMVGARSGAPVAVDVAPLPGVATSAAPTTRLGYVDGLRALAALYVVASHIGQEVWTQQAPSGFTNLLTNALAYGHYAVSMFIVISGFSLMLPVARRNGILEGGARRFYLRRARRILPPYYFALAFALLLIWLFIGRKTGTFWDLSLPVDWRDVVQHIFLINDFALNGGVKINFVFWSIAVESQIYLFFPALVLMWRRYPPLFSVLLTLGLSFILMIAVRLTWVGSLNPYTGSEFIAPFTGLFAMGMFAASVYARPTPRWSRLRGWYLWDILALTSLVVLILKSASWPLYVLDPFVGMLALGLLLAASRPSRCNPVRAALEWRPLVWIGGFSYSLYLIHAPLIQVIWQYALRPLGLGALATYLALLLVGLPLIVLAAWGFWYGCERPFLNARTVRSIAAPSGGPAA